jgi:hypothetical protein
VDNAGNISPAVSTTIRIDGEAPTISGAAAPAPNPAGWNNSDVTVTFTCDDTLSGVDTCEAPVVLTGEGSNLSASGSVTDKAGNTASTTVTGINIDRTAPVVTVTGVSDGASYPQSSVPEAGCSTTDALSGVAVEATLSITGGSPDGTGTFTATCAGALDHAGNTSAPVGATYTVTLTYDFSGFFQPVDNPPTLNVVSAGRAVPIKFSLNGDQGLTIFAAGYPISQRIECETSAPTDTIEQTVSAGTSGLAYDPVTDTYTYTWKTNRSWANTCRQLTIRLSDGTDHTALFMFTR